MSSNREGPIDHFTEALDFLAETEFDIPGVGKERVAIAQVHATLALVEQQRIANLIAAFDMEGGPYKVANNWVRNDGEVEEDAHVYLIREIREGLGL